MDAFTPNPEVWRWAGGGFKGVRLLDSSSERLAPVAEKTEGNVFVTEGALYPETGRPTVPMGGVAVLKDRPEEVQVVQEHECDKLRGGAQAK